MTEIVLNWHPIFVHFTVALFSISTLFYSLAYLFRRTRWQSKTFALEIEVVARWCLWISVLATIATVAAGFYAYYTVKHDVVSHAAMTVHRNWAIPTSIAIFLVACWSVWRYYKRKSFSVLFVTVLFIVQILLLTTAWHGGELVYRHGVGVMSLPQGEEITHPHSPGVEMKNEAQISPQDRNHGDSAHEH